MSISAKREDQVTVTMPVDTATRLLALIGGVEDEGLEGVENALEKVIEESPWFGDYYQINSEEGVAMEFACVSAK